jgi:site-specific DNA-methyltransferase (adenine-specific)
MSEPWEHADENSAKCYAVGIEALRERLEKSKVVINDCVLYCEENSFILPTIVRVDHTISDPPYEDELHEAVGRIRRKDGRKMISSLGFDGINTDRLATAREIVRVSDGWAILFCLAEGVRAWRDDLQAAEAKYDTCLAWVKPDASPRFNGQGAARGFECMVTAWCGKGYRKWNGGGKRGVFTYMVNGDRPGGHPTEKPFGLMRELVHLYTQHGQTILDPFMGSGTTGVACVKLGRKFIGIERERKYFDIAVRRITEAYKQPDLFVSPPENKPEQMTLLESDRK